LLRGRDIKRYSYEFADLYLISTFPSLKVDIEIYPAVKQHLLSFGYDRIKQTGDKGARKKTNNKWFETQDAIGYWDDFSKQKMLWAETMRVHKNKNERFPRFGIEEKGQFVTDKTCFIGTGKDIKFITAILNSIIGKYLCYQYVSILDDGGFLMQKVYLEKILIPSFDFKSRQNIVNLVNNKSENFEEQIDKIVIDIIGLSSEEIKFIEFQ
ncbi:hypothetical protein PUH60_14880, partial [Kaistella sp. SH11-4b]|nr:hypothetical protein [Kaistella sp. SH11-4b]